MSKTVISDILVPEIWTPYVQAKTEIKSRLVQSGAVFRDPAVDKLLAGGGLTFSMPAWKALLRTDAENVSINTVGSSTTPKSIGSFKEIAVRLSRNQSWGAIDLTEALAGEDPMDVIASQVADYWAYRMQIALLAALSGCFKDNDDDDSSDMTKDISGGSFVDGTTNFSAEGMIDAFGTMGDSSSGLSLIWAHSKVVERMKKNNLIDYVADSVNPDAAMVPRFMGREVIEDDSMPSPSSGVYDTYLLGAGSVSWGNGAPKVPVETFRDPHDAGGGGSESLTSRVEWCIHPRGFSFIGSTAGAEGGPSNATSSNNLDHKDSWNRVVPERKMLKLARFRTREF